MGQTVKYLFAPLLLAVLLPVGGCRVPALPAKVQGSVLTYYAPQGRIRGVTTTLNRVMEMPPRISGISRHSKSGRVCITAPERMGSSVSLLLNSFDTAYDYLQAMGIHPLPDITLQLIPSATLPAKWTALLKDGHLYTDFYCTADYVVTQAGRFNRLNNSVATQYLGTLHELIEIALLYGDGARIGYGRSAKARWLREGIATYLAERVIKLSFVCNPFEGSKYEQKYYYASELRSRVLKWRENSEFAGKRGYAASLGIMYALYEATGRQFPRCFLSELSERAAKGEPSAPETVLAHMLNCPVSDFLESIRRPLPRLKPAKNGRKLIIPQGFTSPDAPGLRAGDIILSIDGHSIPSQLELDEVLWQVGMKDEVLITIDRHGQRISVLCRPIAWKFKRNAGGLK